MKDETREALKRKNEALRERLREAEEVLEAIRRGEVDALAISDSQGERIYTLEGADRTYRILIDTMSEGALTISSDGTILYGNNRIEGMLRLPLEKVLGTSIFDFIPLQDRGSLEGLLGGVRGGNARGEMRLVAGDGTDLPVRLSISALELGNASGFCVLVSDLSQEKLAEEELSRYRDHLEKLVAERTAELRESEERFRSLFENSLDAMFLTIADGRVLDANPAACAMFGRPREEFIRLGRAAVPTAHAREEAEAVEQRAREGFIRREMTCLRKDGSKVETDMSSVIVRNAAGDEQAFVIIHDITERKQAEDRLKASLAEKEVLLKEIHHRVKNNMQVISSLVALQADGLQHEVMRDIMRDVVHRVRSMAIVHEKLYQSADLANVQFDEYVRSLLTYLWRAYGSAASGIQLALDLEPVSLSVNQAIPCGLILNELVTNALKHAFGGRAGGVVTLSLRGGADGQVSLCVRDNGLGLPAGFDWRQAHTLGLRLVQMLSGQLHAAVEVSSPGGTEFALTFERPKS